MAEKLEAYYLGENNIGRFKSDLFRAGNHQTFRTQQRANGTWMLMNYDEVPIADISNGYLIIEDYAHGMKETSLLRKVAEEFKTD